MGRHHTFPRMLNERPKSLFRAQKQTVRFRLVAATSAEVSDDGDPTTFLKAVSLPQRAGACWPSPPTWRQLEPHALELWAGWNSQLPIERLQRSSATSRAVTTSIEPNRGTRKPLCLRTLISTYFGGPFPAPPMVRSQSTAESGRRKIRPGGHS